MTFRFDHLRMISDRAVRQGVTPALGLVVGQAGENRYLAAVGHASLIPETNPVAEDSLWDLASLTKPLVTSLLAMHAVAEGRLGLNQALQVGPPGAERQVTLRQLLSHSAGFEAHVHIYREIGLAKASGAGPAAIEGGADMTGGLNQPVGVSLGDPTPASRRAVIEAARSRPAVYPPGSQSIYSDLGYIVLGDWLEEVFGARLDRLARDRIFAPLGLADLIFLPLFAEVPPDPTGEPALRPPPERFVATQRCPVRGRVTRGEVDDLNAWAMGGVSGHAGLFGTLAAVAALIHALIAAFHGRATASGGPLVAERDVLRGFWTPAGVPGSTWRLGWDGPAAERSLAGDRLSRAAVGHLAFTGCSVWIDPARETFVLILANRVHPAVPTDRRFAELRRELGDAALEALGYAA